MTGSDRREDPLADLRTAVTPLSDVGTAAAQRARVVHRMKDLQLATRAPLPRAKSRKRAIAVAALISTAGAAAAAVGTWASFSHEKIDAAAAIPETHTAPAIALPPIATPATTAEHLVPTPPAPAPAPALPHAHRAPRHSTLAEENALLERAMTAKSAGDEKRALSLLDEHLARYPASPVARNAELERLRALERAGDGPAARAAARRYLARYSDGMGSDEARRIAAGSMKAPARPSP